MKSHKQPPRFPTRAINVKDVRVGDRLRQPCKEKVIDLAASIQAVGQLHPIWVRDLGEKGYLLISGNRRLMAHAHLRMTKITAVVVPADAALDQQIEVQENLAREGLSALEEGEHHVMWKRHYDAINAGVEDLTSEQGDDGRNDFVVPPAYTVQAAKKLSSSVRSMQHALRIGGMAEDVRDLLRKTKLADRKVDLLKLSKLSVDEQRRIAQIVAEKKFKSLRDACVYLAAQVAQPDVLPLPDMEAEKLKKVLALTAKLNFKAVANSDECRAVVSRSMPDAHELSATFVLLIEELNPTKIVTITPRAKTGKVKSTSTIVESDAVDVVGDEEENLLDLSDEDSTVADQVVVATEPRKAERGAKSRTGELFNRGMFDEEGSAAQGEGESTKAGIEHSELEKAQSGNVEEEAIRREEEGDDVF